MATALDWTIATHRHLAGEMEEDCTERCKASGVTAGRTTMIGKIQTHSCQHGRTCERGCASHGRLDASSSSSQEIAPWPVRP